jgi:hypothetical protein
MTTVRAVPHIPVWQDRFGRGLMLLASIGALAAFVFSIDAVRSASSNIIWVEAWRMFGFLVFAGMFALLAIRPRRSPGMWELAFFHKVAMGIAAVVLSGVPEAASAGMIDAVLAVMIAVAYVATRGWLSWRVRALE